MIKIVTNKKPVVTVPPAEHFQSFVTAEVRPELQYLQSAESIRDKVVKEVAAILAKHPSATISYSKDQLYIVTLPSEPK